MEPVGRRVARYLDAARSMRLSQLSRRPRRALPPRLLAAGCSRGRPAGWRPLSAHLPADPAPQSGPTPAPDQDGRFVAFGRERRFGAAGFWEPGSDGLLFCFHLHGFAPLADYAGADRTAAGDEFWRSVIEDWRAECERPRGPAWHPYPTSERVIAWTRAVSRVEGWPAELREWMAAEVWRQGRYLLRTVEHDIGGNHVLRNALAICHAGALHPRSTMLDEGLALLESELGDQLLADGAHEERSTSYHRRLTGELSDLASILRESSPTLPVAWLGEAIERAEAWQQSIAGPDGRLPMLNDAWEGPPLVLRSSRRPEVEHLRGSGHIVLRHEGDQAVIDVGPISPRHLPPHAHADVLSFTLWVDRQPLLVDRGAFTYSGPRRDEFRGTGAHNTVTVDGLDQCEFWGDFRAAFHPRVGTSEPERVGDAIVVRAWHDGYRRLDDPVIHRRTFVWLPGAGIVVIDVLDCRRPHLISSRLHAGPSVADVSQRGVGPLQVVKLGGGGEPTLQAEDHAPYLGTTCEASRLEDRREVSPRTAFGWSLLRAGAAVTAVSEDEVTVTGDAREHRIPLSSETAP